MKSTFRFFIFPIPSADVCHGACGVDCLIFDASFLHLRSCEQTSLPERTCLHRSSTDEESRHEPIWNMAITHGVTLLYALYAACFGLLISFMCN